MKRPILTTLATGGLVLSSSVFMACHAADEPEVKQDPTAPPPGMVYYEAVAEQPIGIDAKRLEKYLRKDLETALVKKEKWHQAWNEVFLLSTPEHTRSIPELWIGKYEVTNAQWRVFFHSDANLIKGLQAGEGNTRLGDVVVNAYGITPANMKEFQATWLYLLSLNPELIKQFNKDDDPKWDPLQVEAYKLEIEPGTEIKATRYLPPFGWRNEKNWLTDEPPEDELAMPVRGISWQEAADFCEWAGFHLPREAEFERVVRGAEGRLYPWGNTWEPTYVVWEGFNQARLELIKEKEELAKSDKPEDKAAAEAIRIPDPVGDARAKAVAMPVRVDHNDFDAGRNPEQIYHLIGNVSEWSAERAQKYAGTDSTFRWEGFSQMARGGSYADIAEVMLGTDRIWDGADGNYLTHLVRLDSYGFRLAGYPQPGRDLAAPYAERYSRPIAKSGPPNWFPTPPGLSKSERKDSDLKRAFKKFNEAGTAGFLKRQVNQGVVKDHAYVVGPARGIALMPIKGLHQSINSNAKLKALAENKKGDEVFLVGLLVGTPNMKIKLVDPMPQADPEAPVKYVTVSFADPALQWSENKNPEARKDKTGLMLVVKGGQMAVYRPNPHPVGNMDKYLLNERPLGYLDDIVSAQWAELKGPSAEVGEDKVTLTVNLPSLDKKGDVKKVGKKGTVVTVVVDVPGLRP